MWYGLCDCYLIVIRKRRLACVAPQCSLVWSPGPPELPGGRPKEVSMLEARFIDPDTLAIARLVSKALGITLAAAIEDQAELAEWESA